jgi:hypothetical protein
MSFYRLSQYINTVLINFPLRDVLAASYTFDKWFIHFHFVQNTFQKFILICLVDPSIISIASFSLPIF